MRITTGIFKGRNLKMPEGIRPTQNMVRKAIFDILGEIKGLTFLELFAGSGAVGLEAASRGAKAVVFVENNSLCARAINENIAFLKDSQVDKALLGEFLVIHSDVDSAIKQLSERKKVFDIIFLDPPYSKRDIEVSLAKKTLQSLATYDILPPTGLVIVQYPKGENLPERAGVLNLLKLSAYGDTKLSFYQKETG